jgi:serine/threonine-protein kinase
VVVIGRYAVHGQLGASQTATVSLGRVLRGAGGPRTVAIKRLLPHVAADLAFVGELIREATLAAQVKDANVVSILDVVTEAGEVLLAMEYVHGVALGQLCPRRGGAPLDPRLASAVVSGVLHGLRAAHEAEIVHRDVSPQNVLVGVDGVTRIVDLGVARPGGLRLPYAAPERLRNQPATRASDVYAASVVLWELLTGRPLFDGDDQAAMREEILVGLVDPPSAVARGVPAALSDVVLRGLHSDPRRRFSTTDDMARALEECVSMAPPSEVAAWVTASAAEELERRRMLLREIDPSGIVGSERPKEGATKGRALAVPLSVAAAVAVVAVTVGLARRRPPPVPAATEPLASADPPASAPPLDPVDGAAIGPADRLADERATHAIASSRPVRGRPAPHPAANSSSRPARSGTPAAADSAGDCTSIDAEGLVHYDYDCLKSHAR